MGCFDSRRRDGSRILGGCRDRLARIVSFLTLRRCVAICSVIAESGVIAGKNRRALDSTVLDDAVARQDTVTMLVDQIRRAAN